jgi:sulfate permease, SulP family
MSSFISFRLKSLLDSEYVSRNVAAGIVTSAVTVTYGFSYAAVIFAGELSFAFPYGVAMALITAMAAAIVTAVFGTIPFGIAGPDVYSAVPLAAAVAVVATLLPADMASDARLITVLGTLTLATLITGLGLVGLGLAGAATALRYIPYPVVGGFIAATGLLIIAASLRMVTGTPVTFSTLPQFLSLDAGARVLLTVAFALLIALVATRVKHSLTMPIFVVVGVIAFHLVLITAGVDVETARDAEWLFSFAETAILWNPWSVDLWLTFDWPIFLAVLPNALAVLAVTALAIVMTGTSLEVLTGSDADLNRELWAEGSASLASAGLGGFVGSLSVSRSSVARSAGANGPLAGIVCGLGAGAVLLFGPGVVSYMPKAVLAGILMFLGAQFLWKWMIDSRRDLSPADYLTLVGIVVIVTRYGYVAGVAAGSLAGCIIFAFRYAGTPSIKHVLTLADRRSNVDRSIDASARLSRLGATVPILQLQGYLFFGSAHQLHEFVKKLLSGARFMVIDFKLVSGIDSSAALSFQKMARIADRSGVTLVFAGLPDSCRSELCTAGVIDCPGCAEEFATLDTALEFAEEQLLAEDNHASADERGFRSWLQQQVRSPIAASALQGATRRFDYQHGDYLCRQGEDSDGLLFIESGRVQVLLERDGQEALRLRSIQGRTVLGEMGFFLDTPRSASIIAEAPTVVHRLDRRSFDRLAVDHPAAAAALRELVIRLLSDRLKIANCLIAAYER